MNLQVIAELLGFVAFVALVLERLIEHFISPLVRLLVLLVEPLFAKIIYLAGNGSTPRDILTAWFMSLFALVFGVTISTSFNVDIFTLLAESIGLVPTSPQTGIIMTGFVIGGGSSFLHDLWPQKK